MDLGTAGLFDFVWNRTEESFRDAEARGDELRCRFALRSLSTLAWVGELIEDGASIGEVVATWFLRRHAQDHHRHPEFRAEWRLDDR